MEKDIKENDSKYFSQNENIDETKKIQIRLRRIEGQIKGIEKMVLSKKPCKNVLVQISAIGSAINKVAAMIFRNYADSCLKFYSEKDKKELIMAMKNFSNSKYLDKTSTFTITEITKKLLFQIDDVYKMINYNNCSKEILTVVTRLRISVNMLNSTVFDNYINECGENLSSETLEEIVSTILMFIK